MKSVATLARTCSLLGRTVQARSSTKPVHAFLGIPFAQPPVGDLRFQAPVSSPLWEGQRNATEYGPICPQDKIVSAKTHFPFPLPDAMNEDCLYLNVWTPSLNKSDKLPVMFWIYGGSFLQGFSNYYDGTVYAAHHNVVFVSINYRVGPFGFLSTGDGVVPGNAGLLDQVEALQWVRRHIANFGGDPDNVTIFGESAGGMSCSFHLYSPLTHGLFRRVICQSGVVPYPGDVWPKENARKYIIGRVRKMGFTGRTSKEIVQFLSTYSSDDLVTNLGDGFSPVFDDHYMPGVFNSTLQPHPAQLLLGYNSHEGAVFIFDLLRSQTVSSERVAVDLLVHIVRKMFFRGSPVAEQIIRLAREEYLTGSQDYAQSLTDLYGDLVIIAPTIKAAHTLSGLNPTYVYKYSYRVSLSTYPEWVDADHGQEIPLVMGEPELDRFPDIWTDDDRRISQLLRHYWSNFARTGNPNAHGLPDWPQYDEAKSYVDINTDVNVKTDYEPTRMTLWNDTVSKLVSGNRVYLKAKH